MNDFGTSELALPAQQRDQIYANSFLCKMQRVENLKDGKNGWRGNLLAPRQGNLRHTFIITQNFPNGSEELGKLGGYSLYLQSQSNETEAYQPEEPSLLIAHGLYRSISRVSKRGDRFNIQEVVFQGLGRWITLQKRLKPDQDGQMQLTWSEPVYGVRSVTRQSPDFGTSTTAPHEEGEEGETQTDTPF